MGLLFDWNRKPAYRFISGELPEKLDEVYAIFRYRGAYRRFKALLESHNLLDEWHNFENEQTLNELRQWCERNGIAFTE